MSSLFVKVVTFTTSPHSNADSLSLANPVGTSWQCCIKTESFKAGSLVVYIPIDSLLPVALATALCLPNVKEGKPYRIKTIKLRGEVSQGLLVPLEEIIKLSLLPPQKMVESNHKMSEISMMSDGTFEASGTCSVNFEDWEVGDDVAEALGITKYVEPEPQSKDQRREPEAFIRYTDVENIKNFPDVLIEGEEVIITEKIHGSNARFGWIPTGLGFSDPPLSAGEGITLREEQLWDEIQPCTFPYQGYDSDGKTYDFIIGTRRTALKWTNHTNHWQKPAEKYNLSEKLRPYPGYIIFGEVYGTGVQKLAYGETEVKLRLFDVWDGKRFLDYEEFEQFASEIGVDVAPVLYRGPYSASVLDLRMGKTVVGGGAHIREGVVIRPIKERWEKGLGRVLLKSVSEDYLMGNYEGD